MADPKALLGTDHNRIHNFVIAAVLSPADWHSHNLTDSGLKAVVRGDLLQSVQAPNLPLLELGSWTEGRLFACREGTLRLKDLGGLLWSERRSTKQLTGHHESLFLHRKHLTVDLAGG